MMTSIPLRRSQSGMTVVELMIVILIGGVLAVLAVPSLQSVLRSTRQNSAVSALVADLNLARGEAIKRNARMLMCARNADGSNCGTDWNAGWVVCAEGGTPNECAASTAALPNPIAIRSAVEGSLRLAVASPSVAGIAAVRFSANSAQTSKKSTNPSDPNDGRIDLVLTGTWSDARTRTIRVETTGYISTQ